MGTAFPLFTQQMYDRLTYHWGTSLFGFVAVVMIPIPFVRIDPLRFLHMSLTRSFLGVILEGSCHPCP